MQKTNFGRNRSFDRRKDRSFRDHFNNDENSSEKRSSYPDRNSENSRSDRRGPQREFGRSRFSGGYGRSSYSGRNRGRPEPRQNISFSKYVKEAKPVTLEEYQSSFKFEDLNINQDLKNCILNRGFSSPTPIQDKTIPSILEGRDVLGLAATGTGKTGAFLIPLIDQCIQALKNREKWQCLIVAPTRELATQIEDELIKLTTKEMRIFSTSLVGGRDIFRQIQRLKKPNQFLIGTPGRLVDLVNRNVLKLENSNAVVLDEVDRMLDMGFVDDITFLIDQLPKERQSLFFSATLDKKLENIVHSFLQDPVTVSIKTESASENVHQDVIKVSKNEKFEELKKILDKPETKKVLIFTETKSFTERLYQDLDDAGYSVESIHGDKSTGFRKRALDSFKSNKKNILVATDVAARGLDVSDITHVINYDQPRDYETYIHRVGRAGRAGKVGWAYTFVS